MGNENCPHCGNPDECANECDITYYKGLKGKSKWCKQACNSDGLCYYYYSNSQKCYCASGCDNVVDNTSPWVSNDLAEGYGIGVISTLFILIVALLVYYVIHKLKTKSRKVYGKVLQEFTTDDEEIALK